MDMYSLCDSGVELVNLTAMLKPLKFLYFTQAHKNVQAGSRF